jgi:hypothetical protein
MLLPPDALAAKSNSEDWHERSEVARNPATPLDALLTLSGDAHPEVQIALAKNPNCPPALRVAILAKSDDPDPRALAALLCATHRLPPVVPHPSVTLLKEVAVIAQRDLLAPGVPWPPRPKSIADLPGRTSLPWNVAGTTDSLVGRLVHPPTGQPLTLRRLDSEHALEQNANYMGNCTAGYAPDIARGDAVILALDDASGKPLYNVELRRRDSPPTLRVPNPNKEWYLGQVNSRFNSGEAPPWVMGQLGALVDDLSAPLITPVNA